MKVEGREESGAMRQLAEMGDPQWDNLYPTRPRLPGGFQTRGCTVGQTHFRGMCDQEFKETKRRHDEDGGVLDTAAGAKVYGKVRSNRKGTRPPRRP